ncbi:hypothetical protein B0T10DRAFT_572129 [Thelonectria olida]|uniref:Uncharacterized protein n=1 Tax=Thelonectria olida TaxID=1576542 RepID=A0A9P8W5E2_9HYPO|nr:hypothetical protein B0T10DRAFT_572129 [Thelonectria olida]
MALLAGEDLENFFGMPNTELGDLYLSPTSEAIFDRTSPRPIDDTTTSTKVLNGQSLVYAMIDHADQNTEEEDAFGNDIRSAVSELSEAQRCWLSSVASIILAACGSSVDAALGFKEKDETPGRFSQEDSMRATVEATTTESKATSKLAAGSDPQTKTKTEAPDTIIEPFFITKSNADSEIEDFTMPEVTPGIQIESEANSIYEETDPVSKDDSFCASDATTKPAATSHLPTLKECKVDIEQGDKAHSDAKSAFRPQADSGPDFELATTPSGIPDVEVAANPGGMKSMVDEHPSSRVAEAMPRESPQARTSWPEPIETDLELIELSMDEFIQQACTQVQCFASTSDSREAYREVFDSLSLCNGKAGAQWSKPDSKLISLIARAENDHIRGTLYYTMTALMVFREHESRVKKKTATGVPRETASKEVTNGLISDEGVGTQRAQRSRLTNMLKRGRKWSLLVEKLGYGIFFMNAWYLGRAKEEVLYKLIEGLLESLGKMAVLRLLSGQVEMLMNTQMSSPDSFREQLLKEQLLLPDVVSQVEGTKLQELYERVKDLGASQLMVKENGFQLDVSSLQRLEEKTWLNDQIILACLHLAKRQRHIRIGFGISIHMQTRSGVMQRPFEKASRRMVEWHGESAEESLVGIFVLFQRNNHFSLLEINEVDNCIYHYDSLGKGENVDIKRACKGEFPGFKYYEQV